jgi:hypothetical protein
MAGQGLEPWSLKGSDLKNNFFTEESAALTTTLDGTGHNLD